MISVGREARDASKILEGTKLPQSPQQKISPPNVCIITKTEKSCSIDILATIVERSSSAVDSLIQRPNWPCKEQTPYLNQLIVLLYH